MITVDRSQDDEQLRLIDDAFAKISNMINDISIEVRVIATNLLVIIFRNFQSIQLIAAYSSFSELVSVPYVYRIVTKPDFSIIIRQKFKLKLYSDRARSVL